MRNENHSLRSASYQILAAYYDRIGEEPNAKLWEIIKEVLCEIGMNSAVKELGIDELIQETGKSVVSDTMSAAIINPKSEMVKPCNHEPSIELGVTASQDPQQIELSLPSCEEDIYTSAKDNKAQEQQICRTEAQDIRNKCLQQIIKDFASLLGKELGADTSQNNSVHCHGACTQNSLCELLMCLKTGSSNLDEDDLMNFMEDECPVLRDGQDKFDENTRTKIKESSDLYELKHVDLSKINPKFRNTETDADPKGGEAEPANQEVSFELGAALSQDPQQIELSLPSCDEDIYTSAKDNKAQDNDGNATLKSKTSESDL